jgi:hypothetical protein
MPDGDQEGAVMPSHKIKKSQSNGGEGATQTLPTTGSSFLSLALARSGIAQPDSWGFGPVK